MWLLLSILLGIGGCFVIMLFCLVSAGKRADEGEEKILKLLSENSRDEREEDTSIRTSEVAIVR